MRLTLLGEEIPEIVQRSLGDGIRVLRIDVCIAIELGRQLGIRDPEVAHRGRAWRQLAQAGDISGKSGELVLGEIVPDAPHENVPVFGE